MPILFEFGDLSCIVGILILSRILRQLVTARKGGAEKRSRSSQKRFEICQKNLLTISHYSNRQNHSLLVVLRALFEVRMSFRIISGRRRRVIRNTFYDPSSGVCSIFFLATYHYGSSIIKKPLVRRAKNGQFSSRGLYLGNNVMLEMMDGRQGRVRTPIIINDFPHFAQSIHEPPCARFQINPSYFATTIAITQRLIDACSVPNSIRQKLAQHYPTHLQDRSYPFCMTETFLF